MAVVYEREFVRAVVRRNFGGRWKNRLSFFFPEFYKTHEERFFTFILEIAKRKESNLREENELLEHFFEVVEYLLSNNKIENHSKNPNQIAIRFPEFEEAAGEKKILFNRVQLFDEIKKSRRYVDYKSIRNLSGKKVSVWIFWREGCSESE